MMTALDLSPCYQELGFSEPPFRITPDTDFFFQAPAISKPYNIFALESPAVG